VIAAGIGTIVAMLFTENLVFKLAFAVTYLAVAWIGISAARIPDLRDLIKQGYESTMRLTCMVTFILIGSTCFSVVFLGVSGGVWLEHLLTSLPGGVWGFLIFINLFIFFLAFFLDFFEIAFIILPLLGPVADKMGIDLVWFGVMLCVNMQTSFMHPPFGFALFYLRGISDTLFKNGSIPRKVESNDIYLGSIPWVLMQLILVAIVIFFPQTVTAFLDKEKAVDLNQASELLQQMGDHDKAREMSADDASKLFAPEPAASAASAPTDDGDAVRRALEEAAKK